MSNHDRPKATAARRATRLLEAAPVLILAAIAGAGSFVHIRDTAAQHGQHGPMSWAIAICIDLTCVMAARERQRDKHSGRPTRRISWPTIVLTGGVLLSLAANLDQAEPTTWGRITAATPAAAFLIAVSMIERRRTPQAWSAQPSPAVLPVRAQDGDTLPVPAPSPHPAGPLLDYARRVAADHHAAHGQPSPATRSEPASASPTSSPPNYSATSDPPSERRPDDPPHLPQPGPAIPDHRRPAAARRLPRRAPRHPARPIRMGSARQHPLRQRH